MTKITLPYAHLLDKSTDNQHLIKVQSLISREDKRAILAILGGDDGIYSYIIQTAFVRTADYIRSQNLSFYDASSRSRVLDFIRNGSDTCPVRDAVTHAERGAGETSQPASKTIGRIPTDSTEVHQGRGRTEEKVKVKRSKRAAG